MDSEILSSTPKDNVSKDAPNQIQLNILQSNFRFYHAWTPSSFEEYERPLGRDNDTAGGSESNQAADSIVVSGISSMTRDDFGEQSIRDFFSAFGSVVDVNQTDEMAYVVTFERGSDGVKNTIDSQPIKMFGGVIHVREIQTSSGYTVPQFQEKKLSNKKTFPLIVASPRDGPWYVKPKPSEKLYMKPSANTSSPGQITYSTVGKLAAVASKMIATNLNSRSTQISSSVAQTSQKDSCKQTPSTSLHSLLSSTCHDPLFEDDGDGGPSEHGSSIKSIKYFQSDGALPAWVWAPNQSISKLGNEDSFSDAERQLSSTLEFGRASNATQSLLASVSNPTTQMNRDANSEFSLEDTNLNVLHKQSTITVINNSTGQNSLSYTLYQARHPCLAPLISAMRCNSEPASNQKVSAVSIFDITPSRHQPLHEMLRTGDLLTKPLYPEMEGHVSGLVTSSATGIQQHKNLESMTRLAWFRCGNGGERDLCRCRTIFDRGRDAEPNLSQEDSSLRAELRQFRSSTSTMFSMLTDQEIFHDFKKLCLLPQSSLHHPQVYTSSNQTTKLCRVGNAYHSDVADLRIQFLALQLFHAVNFLHSKRQTLGNQLRPDRIFVQEDGWLRLIIPINEGTGCSVEEKQKTEVKRESRDSLPKEAPSKYRVIFDHHEGKGINRIDNKTPQDATVIPYPGYGLVPFAQWQKGQLSNLAYLMMVNAAAGRTLGDQVNPPILPWVTDFTSMIDLNQCLEDYVTTESPWRDLTKTKYRLHKGDEQLDQSYNYGEPAHHVPETISDLTYTVYRARSLPIFELQAKVRNQFIAEHYPNSIERLYHWTPDEATPEFYIQSDTSNIFISKHKEMMNDLLLPDWCNNDPSAFISYHRRLLESRHVTNSLHYWIDLMFGVGLSGERAVLEKNVVLRQVKWNPVHTTNDKCTGSCYSPVIFGEQEITEKHHAKRGSVFVQLFSRPHPRRIEPSGIELKSNVPSSEHLNETYPNIASDSFAQRKKHDLSMIGAIVEECYASARVIPDAGVQNAIECLLEGHLDIIKLSLQYLDEPSETLREGIFPFPSCLKSAYRFLSQIQSNTFSRDEFKANQVVSDDLTVRSSSLEKIWITVRNAHVVNSSLTDASLGLLMPALLSPMMSPEPFVENYKISRSYASFADTLVLYITILINRFGTCLSPVLFQLFNTLIVRARDCEDLVVTEKVGRVMLAESLISSLCLHQSDCIHHIMCFITSQICKSNVKTDLATPMSVDSIARYFVTFLSRDSGVGTAICSRYIVPLLVCRLEECAVANDSQNMAIQTLRSIVPFLPSDTVGIVVVKPVLKKVWQKISFQENIHPNCRVDVLTNFPMHLLRDLVSLLSVCLRQIETQVETYFFRSTPMCIPQLLLLSFKATVSAQETAQEVFYGICLLVQAMITNPTHAVYLTKTLLPTSIESLASQVNDQISLERRMDCEKKCVDDQRDEILQLPGIADACMVAREAVKVFDRNCLPAALELLAWVDHPLSVRNGQTSPAKDKELANNTHTYSSIATCNLTNEPNDAWNPPSEEDILLVSSEPIGNDAIEMLAPRQNTTVDDIDSDSEDENGDIGSKVKSTLAKSSPTIVEHVEHNHQDNKKRDLAWSIGVHRLPEQKLIKYRWHPRFMATTSLEIKSGNDSERNIASMSSNKSETLLVAGNSLGEIFLFDLRRHPPSMISSRKVIPHRTTESSSNAKKLSQVGFVDAGNVLVCHGGLHIWDAETGVIATSKIIGGYRPQNRSLAGFHFLAYSQFPFMTSSSEILYTGCGEIAAISPRHLYMVDMRCDPQKESPTFTATDTCHSPYQNRTESPKHLSSFPMMKHLSWHTEESPTFTATDTCHSPYQNRTESPKHLSSFNLKCVAAHSDFVCVGSSSGHIHCYDRRQSKLQICWKAHTKSIEYLKAVSRGLLLSVSADKTAVLWNLMKNPPQQISSIYSKTLIIFMRSSTVTNF